MDETELIDTYPSVEEQRAILSVIQRKYPIPKKYPKPRDSYPHWRVDTLFHRPDAIYFHVEHGRHRSDSDIRSDFFAWRWTAQRQVWLKVDRQTREMTEITKEDFDLTRGCRVNDRGIVEWHKDGKWPE